MKILITIISIFILLLFILLLPQNAGMGSLTGGSDKKNSLPFTKSQKLFFILGIIFIALNYIFTYIIN